MKDLKLFATDAWPLHPSAMQVLVTCPWQVVSMFLLDPTGEGGPAADTGSAMHAAAAAFHKGSTVAESIGVMGAKLADYPRADLNDAANLFLQYAQDTRNRDAKIVDVEIPIAYTIAPAPEDPTQAPISVVGRVDQVREEFDGLSVLDIKTSKLDPMAVANKSTLQVAAYAVGVAVKYNRPVSSVKLILPRRYKADPSTSPVFWHYPWAFKDLEQILSAIRHAVALVRSGVVWHVPNDGCMWCVRQTPDLCLPALQELGLRKTSASI